jgi:hypothetical protein
VLLGGGDKRAEEEDCYEELLHGVDFSDGDISGNEYTSYKKG